MKNFSITLFILSCAMSACAQRSEFNVYPNGLIYSEKTMSKLKHVVDSLNLKFKTCNFNQAFYSQSQTIGHKFILDEASIKQAKKDLNAQISYEDFIAKYPKADAEINVLFVKNRYTDYRNKEVVAIEEVNLKGSYNYRIVSEDLSLYNKDFTKQWLFQYREKTEYSEESLTAFYFPNNFSSVALPQKYAYMIGYSECMIDTSSTKLKENCKQGYMSLPDNWTSLSEEKKVELLDELRGVNVVGGCSMDNSPRIHAINIALLAAETQNWEVFLKAHLDIMNDRFDRVSDGSYAWGARNTYIKELEELNINVTDLILGISFRVENPAGNHYFGSLTRVGRALAESSNPAEMEQSMLSIISDQGLDNYNRVLFYFLFYNYNYYLKDEKIKKENNEKLIEAVKTLPEYLSTRLLEK